MCILVLTLFVASCLRIATGDIEAHKMCFLFATQDEILPILKIASDFLLLLHVSC
jgi:hypothetical protein